MKKVDRWRALEMCLTLLEAQMRIASKNFTLLSPREGYDGAWEELREAMAQVREMMREEREKEHESTTNQLSSDGTGREDVAGRNTEKR